MASTVFSDLSTALTNALNSLTGDLSTLKNNVTALNTSVTNDVALMNTLITNAGILQTSIETLDADLQIDLSDVANVTTNIEPQVAAALAGFQSQLNTLTTGYNSTNTDYTTNVAPQIQSIHDSLAELIEFAGLSAI